MSQRCPECGESFGDDARLCPYHGVELEETSDEDRLIGEVVDDRFRLERLLGKGGMGRVYEATQLSVERRVAVKLIRYREDVGGNVRERFEREARVVSGLNHPNIVRLIDFGRDEDRDVPYIAMEFIDGLEVGALLEDGRFHPNLALEIASQISAALVEAHGADIVHRDLKTDNVLLVPVSSGGFQVKVIDFGIAFPRTSSDRLTNTGMICGTPRYVSPEQARGGEVGPRSDLYSLGVVIFEMVTGLLPFEADSAFNVMMKHVQQPPPSLGQILDDELPESVGDLVDDLLRKDPASRPKDASAVGDRIREIREAHDWGPIELRGEAPLREELQEWLEPPLDPDVAGGSNYDVVETGDSLQISAPNFEADATAAESDVDADADTESAPGVVGVPGSTGAPMPERGSETADDEESPPTEGRGEEGADWVRRAVPVAAALVLATLGAWWFVAGGADATDRATTVAPGAPDSGSTGTAASSRGSTETTAPPTRPPGTGRKPTTGSGDAAESTKRVGTTPTASGGRAAGGDETDAGAGTTGPATDPAGRESDGPEETAAEGEDSTDAPPAGDENGSGDDQESADSTEEQPSERGDDDSEPSESEVDRKLKRELRRTGAP